RFGWLDRDQRDLTIPRFNQQGRQAALEAARESMVLLKNDGELLPLNKGKLKTIAVIGPTAYPAVPIGGGSAGVQPFVARSYLEGLSNYLGTGANVTYTRGIPSLGEMAEATNFSTAPANGKPGLNAEYFNNETLQGTPTLTRTEQHVNFGGGSRPFPDQAISARWTGYYVPQSAGPQDLFVQSTGEDGGAYRLYVDDKLVLDNWTTNTALTGMATVSLDAAPHKVVLEHRGRSQWLGARLKLGIIRHGQVVEADAKKLAAMADVVVVAVGFGPDTESEGADRTFQLPPGQDELIEEMAAANKRTVVVITSGGGTDMSAWAERVPAILEAWYPGQEGGTALAEILFGEVNPSGRLPVTFGRRWEDSPVRDSYYPAGDSRRVEYKEDVFVGYRGYEKNGVKPLFPFGYGLSYTTFKYSDLSIKAVTGAPPAGTSSGPRYEVSFDVQNTGKREGMDVAQVYVGDTHSRIPRPAKELKGFTKVSLRPGEKRRVTVMLDARSLSFYDADARRWRAEPGDFDVLVGRSSAEIELRGKLTLAGATAMAAPSK
ncbi:MAG TPA: glycoside hydrolase family 3 C-terminal domain-containing protein, partial [Pyrinomonadaceae bacterium]|nr:glycoside hydrolase family 3 C-terminal domain-containing protein [Pyrinomonadaceae bacterium]